MDDRRHPRCGLPGHGHARHARRDAGHDAPHNNPSRNVSHDAPHDLPHDFSREISHGGPHGGPHGVSPDPAARPGPGEAPADDVLREAGRDDPAARIIARLADIGSRLGAQPRQEFRTRLRETLLSAHESARHTPRHASRRGRQGGQPVPPPPPIRTSLLVRLRPAVLVAGLAAVMLLASWGTQRAVPGDLLYPLKRGAESALVSLSMNETARAERELVTARNRAAEAAALAEDPQAKELLEETIDDMASSTRSALSTLTRVKPRNTSNNGKLRRFAKEQRNMVEPLLPSLKGSSKAKANAYLHLIEGFEGS